MVQHLLMGDLGALLIVLGLTGPLLQPLLANRWLGWLRHLAHPLVALPLWAIDLYVWHVPVLYQAATEHSCDPRAPAQLLHRLRRPDVDAARWAAAAAEVVRDPGEDRLPDRGALRRHRARQRLHVVELGLLSRLRARGGEVAHLGGDRPEHRRRDHDGGGRPSSPSACSPGSSSSGRSRTPSASASSTSLSSRGVPLSDARAARAAAAGQGARLEERIKGSH